jgi:hypothetical protein
MTTLEWLEEVACILVAVGGLLLFAYAFGVALDNHAARLDPASPQYTQKAP